jgi:hypothetical protein
MTNILSRSFLDVSLSEAQYKEISTSRNDTQTAFYKVIAAPVVLCEAKTGLSIDLRKEMRYLSPFFENRIVNLVRDPSIRNALQLYSLERRIQY